MWLQQAKSISQEEGDIPDVIDREEEMVKVNCGNGDSGSRRLGFCKDGSHWLDAFSVSNSSNKNGSS